MEFLFLCCINVNKISRRSTRQINFIVLYGGVLGRIWDPFLLCCINAIAGTSYKYECKQRQIIRSTQQIQVQIYIGGIRENMELFPSLLYYCNRRDQLNIQYKNWQIIRSSQNIQIIDLYRVYQGEYGIFSFFGV